MPEILESRPTKLIVALDGPEPWDLLMVLRKQARVDWYKIGPQAMMAADWHALISHAYDCSLFLDLKLADTRETVREAVKRFAAAKNGPAAVSTYTYEATLAASEAASGYPLKVWQVLNLSDDEEPLYRTPLDCAHGFICSGQISETLSIPGHDKVVPGVRLGDNPHGHRWTMAPPDCRRHGVTHAVVGRPIWQATDPVAVARSYMEHLSGQGEKK